MSLLRSNHFPSSNRSWIVLSREVGAIEVPAGCDATLPKDFKVEMVHDLGGDFTVRSQRGVVFRIDGKDADALGRAPSAAPRAPEATEFSEDAVMDKLRMCFDPEIPVNIVELGLVYESVVEPLPGNNHRIHIKMTLTAPGCGMAQVIVDDVKRKVESVPGVSEAKIELVFDPPWEPSMMSEAARLQAGLL